MRCEYNCLYKDTFGECLMDECVHPQYNYANRICPYCGDANHIHYLHGLSKIYEYKCTNCNRYLNESDFYVGKHERRSR